MNINKMITFAAVAASAMAANADTITTNGVTWTYTVNDATAKTITLGAAGTTAMPQDAEWNASEIPGKFIIDGETYTVTRIGGSGFMDCIGLRGVLRIPHSITHIDCNGCFRGCGLTGVSSWGGVTHFKDNLLKTCTALKGPLPSFSQFTGLDTGDYNSFAMFNECYSLTGVCIAGNIKLDVGYMFRKATSMKILLAGPGTSVVAHLTQNSMFNSVSSKCVVIVPRTGWDGLKLGGNGNTVTYYGPADEITSLTIDETHRVVSMTPTTKESFTNALEFASLFKEHLDLDTRISVTNTLDLTGVTITEDMTSGVTFDRLMFSAKEQTQLDAILGAFPATTPISIDPTGLTENMVVPDDYPNVFVKTVPGVMVRRTASGFMIIVK